MSLEEALVAVGVFTSEQLPTESEREEAEEDALDGRVRGDGDASRGRG